MLLCFHVCIKWKLSGCLLCNSQHISLHLDWLIWYFWRIWDTYHTSNQSMGLNNAWPCNKHFQWQIRNRVQEVNNKFNLPLSGIIVSPSFLSWPSPRFFFFLHSTSAAESVSNLFVCSYGQVKWPVLGILPSMAGRRVLWWGNACRKMLAPTPAWQRTVQGRRPAVLLCLSEVRETLGNTWDWSMLEMS